MDFTNSYLSNKKYGYDFTVATTQESINSSLLEYLDQSNHPVKKKSKYFKTEEEFKKLTDVDPFKIPACGGTDYASNTDIKTLTSVLFGVGIEIKVGLPADVDLDKLPQIVTLGSSVKSVAFNLLCEKVNVVQNNPGSGFGGGGHYNVYNQPKNEAWYVSAIVNIDVADLDKELNTPYFNAKENEKEKAALLKELKNMSGTAFDLQQLLFVLNDSILQTGASFKGLDPINDADAISLLGKSFQTIYQSAAKEQGLPLLGVSAVPQDIDPSPLQITSFERQITLLKDENGDTIDNPSNEQLAVTTLDYICATENHPRPRPAAFDWNWVRPDEIDKKDGVIAINRNSIGNFLLPQIVANALPNCLMIDVVQTGTTWKNMDYKFVVYQNSPPYVKEVTKSGETVILVKQMMVVPAQALAPYNFLTVTANYECSLTFKKNAISVTQHSFPTIVVAKDVFTWWGFSPVGITITDIYELSVDQNGGVHIMWSFPK